MKRVVAAFLLLALLLVVHPAFAARRKPPKPQALDEAAPIAINESAPYVFGQSLTVTVNTTEEWPWVQNVCFQDGNLVYEEWRGMYPGYPSPGPFMLGPTNNWTGGDAECEARLVIFNGGAHVLAMVAYHVEG